MPWKRLALANRRRVASTAAGAAAGLAGGVVLVYAYRRDGVADDRPGLLVGKFGRVAHAEAASLNSSERLNAFWTPPQRREQINRLKGFEKDGVPPTPEKLRGEPPFDLLVIGGGATGAGAALDGVTRGLKVALLVHGGVRYLEKAFWDLDYDQYKLVREALHERAVFLKIAPFIIYDLLAGKEGLFSSYFLSAGKALEAFPMLKTEKLCGALVYYDGQHNDSRMN
ncbi:MAG: hypothetical protein BJ554DRAFT_1677, partial [Olpidium bornovanus]